MDTLEISMLKIQKILVLTTALVILPVMVYSQSNTKRNDDRRAAKSEQEIQLRGYALERFIKGPLIHHEMLDDQSRFAQDWIIQQSQMDSNLTRYSRVKEGKLHIHDPRGTTVWYKTKLAGPVMISYRVTCPSEYNSGTDIVPRDINQFWMTNTPGNEDPFAEGGLFDNRTFNGEFDSYHLLNGYYASTGGGNISKNNRTTRLRRYPRTVAGTQVDHVALCSRDDVQGYLIHPDKEHLIQLVAAEDVVQYLFDGKVVYEIKKGDTVDILNDGNAGISKTGIWGSSPWSWYREGYFGFRMTRTHHVYSDFRVYKLLPKK
jgi:hypothetical protein